MRSQFSADDIAKNLDKFKQEHKEIVVTSTPIHGKDNQSSKIFLRITVVTKQNLNQSHIEIERSLKVSEFRKDFLKFSFAPKTNENIFVFLP